MSGSFSRNDYRCDNSPGMKRPNSFVWKLEAGKRQLNVVELIEIARALNVRASTLLTQIEG
jgi:hypothetical protein